VNIYLINNKSKVIPKTRCEMMTGRSIVYNKGLLLQDDNTRNSYYMDFTTNRFNVLLVSIRDTFIRQVFNFENIYR